MSSSSPPPTAMSVTHHLSRITKPYTQTLLASLDDTHDIKIALLEGPMALHSHSENDEAFYLISGSLTIEIQCEEGQEGPGGARKIRRVEMSPGNLYVVEQGVKHRPVGNKAQVMVIEKKGVLDGSGGIAKPVDT